MGQTILGWVAAAVTCVSMGQVYADSGLDEARAIKDQLTSAKAKLDGAVDKIKDSDAKVAVLEALREISNALENAGKIEVSLTGTDKIDSFVEQARAIQKVMGGFLGEKNMFGYKLRNDTVDVQIDIGGVYKDVVRDRLKKAGIDIGAEGHIHIGANQDLRAKLNSLSAEYYGVLVEAAAISKSDDRVKALAQWANDTKVLQSDEFQSDPLISTQQLWALKLN